MSQSTSSEVSGHSKKISTTSFGSTTGGDYLSTTLERSLKDKSEVFGKYLEIVLKEINFILP